MVRGICVQQCRNLTSFLGYLDMIFGFIDHILYIWGWVSGLVDLSGAKAMGLGLGDWDQQNF